MNCVISRFNLILMELPKILSRNTSTKSVGQLKPYCIPFYVNAIFLNEKSMVIILRSQIFSYFHLQTLIIKLEKKIGYSNRYFWKVHSSSKY